MSDGVCRVRISAVRGSTPRDIGAEMIVAPTGLVRGSIGGGALEFRAIARAQSMLAKSQRGANATELTILGPDLAQCCGGVVELTYSVERAHAIVTPRRSHKLVIYGAGHIGRAVVRATRDLPLAITWIDDAAARYPTEIEPHTTPRVVADLNQAADLSDPTTFHLVVTYAHAADEALCEAILRHGAFGWLGLIASETKAARFRRRFADRGLDHETIARLKAPVGVPGIASKDPAFIAISIAAEIAAELARISSERQNPAAP